MAHYTNNGAGMRGIVTEDGNTVWLEPGETVELDKKQVKSVHEDITEGAKAAKEAAAETPEA